MKTLAQVRKIVKCGIKLLNQHNPGWYGNIQLGRFEITSTVDCPLGQVYGHYSKGIDTLGLSFSQAERYGFDAIGVGVDLFNKVWKEEIKALQQANNGKVQTFTVLTLSDGRRIKLTADQWDEIKEMAK